MTEAVIGEGALLDFRDDFPETPFRRSSLTTSSSSSVKSTTLFGAAFLTSLDSEVFEIDLGFSRLGFGDGRLKRFGVSGFGGLGVEICDDLIDVT